MITFQYTAKDPTSGQKTKGVIQADSEQAAAKLIREQGMTPVSISQGGGASAFLDKFNRIKAKDRVLFSRQLATLINAGLPLVQSLRNVNEQTTNKKFKVIIQQIIGDIEGGSAFSVALGKFPDVFNQVYVNMIAAGEASGTLDQALERLAIQQEKDAELISKVRSAMYYPVIVLCVMFAVMGFMLVKVLPQVKILYAGLGGAGGLPLVTRILLAVSDFIIHFWYIMIIVLVLLIFFGSRWARTLGGKTAIDKFKMTAPPTGTLFMKMYMARFARTAGTLIASGVPLLQVLDITANAVNNVHITNSIHKAMEKVKGGKALSDALTGDPNFLPLVPSMLHIGEQSGQMEQMLDKTATYYEREVDDAIKAISTIIEPVLMVILGIFAFTIVAAVLLPIYGLAGKSFLQI